MPLTWWLTFLNVPALDWTVAVNDAINQTQSIESHRIILFYHISNLEKVPEQVKIMNYCYRICHKYLHETLVRDKGFVVDLFYWKFETLYPYKYTEFKSIELL